ncbi:carboxypeptidase regulatory-like domain-containing protein [Neorhodopirellula lusitana]|uniref:carboxypeptidase regulatory-like domain-containing protein n=1 Tax=Neorhodopirellula lusitana TaxID=445327 RepID=UPI00384C5E2C
MSKTNIEPDARQTRLRDWRDEPKTSGSRLRVKMLFVVVLVVLLAMFVVSIWRPLGSPQLSIQSMGPTSPSKSNSVSNIPAQAVALATLKAMSSFGQAMPTATVTPTLSLAAANQLAQSDSTNGPQLVHLAGTALVVDGHAILLSLSSDSTLQTSPLDVSELLGRLDGIQSPVIVMIDAIESVGDSIGRLPEMTAWQFAQCIDRDVSKLSDANVVVVTHHSQINHELANPSDHITPLTQAAISGFEANADINANGVVSVAEWLDVVSPERPDQDNERVPQSFSSIPRTRWKHFRLAPVQVVPETADTATPKVSADAITELPSVTEEAAVKDRQTNAHVVDVTAPTLAVALKMHADGIRTNGSDQCKDLRDELQKLLSADASETAANKWIERPIPSNATWDELVWTRSVMQQGAPWSLKQSLIKCRMLADQLETNPTVRQWFAPTLSQTQWVRLDAERSLLSPVRPDYLSHVREQTEKAVRSFTRLQQDAESIDRAHDLRDQIVGHLNALVAMPIHARSLKDDSVCQLLSEAVDLQGWLDAANSDSMHQGNAIIESIESRMASLLAALQTQKEHSAAAIQTVAVSRSSEGFVESTRTRIQRSTLAAKLELAETTGAFDVLTKLQKAAENASETLLNASTSEDEMVTAVDQYKQLVRGLKSNLNLSAQRNILATDLDAAKRGWSEILPVLVADTRDWAVDATHEEREQYTLANSRYQRLANWFGLPAMARVESDTVLDVTVQGSLSISDSVILDVAILSSSQTMNPGFLEIETDHGWLKVDKGGDSAITPVQRIAGETDYHSVIAQRATSQHSMLQRATSQHVTTTATKSSVGTATSMSQTTASIEIRRQTKASTQKPPEGAAINLRWITRNDIFRASVPVEMPLSPFVTARSTSGDSWVMHANRDRFAPLWIQPLDSSSTFVQVRLLGWSEPNLACPPTMKADQAKRWFATQTPPAELAIQSKLATSLGQWTKVMFPAAKLEPDAPPIAVASLWCEVTDLDNDRVQWIDLSPRVYRPDSLIQPRVAYDHNARKVDVSIKALTGVDESTHVRIELVDLQTHQIVAHGEQMLAPDSDVTKSFSSAACDGHPIGVRVLSDQWPSSFVFRLAGNRSEQLLKPSDDHAAVVIGAPLLADSSASQDASPVIVPKHAPSVSAEVWVDLTDSLFRYGTDVVTLGLDLNGDRYLQDEPTVSVTTPAAIEFAWAGVDPVGQPGLRSRVRPHQLAVPVGVVKNRRAPLIASLQRGEQLTWSNPITAVFDALPPKLSEVQIRSPLPAILGGPLDVRVTVDDEGLSEAASIRAAWATSGQQEFTTDVKPVPGQRLGDGSWAVILPTDKLASGTHTMLIQATDAAQNAGVIKTVAVELLTEAELLARRAAEVTVLQGQIAYVTRPVPGMKVALTLLKQEKPDNPDEKSVEQPSQTSNLPQEAMTDASGHFVFPAVKAGQYELKLDGLYRGDRYRKSVKVAVKPPQPTDLSTIRID